MARSPISTLLVLALGLAGCGGDSDGDGDGDAPDASRGSDAAALDASALDAAAPDGPPASTLGVTDEDGVPLTGDVELPAAAVGGSSATLVRVVNGGSASTAALGVTVSGEAAADFELVAEVSTCPGAILPPGGVCDVALLFRPTAAGPRAAVLAVASEGGGVLALPLLAVGFVSEVALAPSELAFGARAAGTSTSLTLEITNAGSTAAAVGDLAVDDPAFALGFDTCGATLAAGATCDVAVRFAPVDVVAHVGAVSVTVDGLVRSAALTGRGAMALEVVVAGNGAGVVTSSPAGIACGSACGALFTTDVVLTAEPASDSVFGGWSRRACGVEPTCTVPLEVAASVTATFSLTGDSTISVVFAGDAAGELRLRRVSPGDPVVLATCTASCVVPAAPGDRVAVTVATPATLSGLTGCGGAGGCSQIDVVAGTNTLTATFAPAPFERWTRLIDPGVALEHVLCDAGGDALVPTSAGLVKLAAAGGATVWSRPISAFGLGPTGSIFGYEGGAVIRRDADGAVEWSTPVAGGTDVSVSRTGEVAVLGGGALTRVTPTGAVAWSRSVAGDPLDVAIDSTGLVYVPIETPMDPERQDVRRFAAADGTELAPFEQVALGYREGDTLLDVDDRLVTSSSGFSSVWLVRTDATGMRDLLRRFEGGFAGAIENDVAVSAGGIAWWHFLQDDEREQRIRLLDSAGTEVADLDRRRTESDADGILGVEVRDVAVCADGSAILVGRYTGLGYDGGWVQAVEP